MNIPYLYIFNRDQNDSYLRQMNVPVPVQNVAHTEAAEESEGPVSVGP